LTFAGTLKPLQHDKAFRSFLRTFPKLRRDRRNATVRRLCQEISCRVPRCAPTLSDRKHRLRAVVPHEAERLLYCDHIEEHGEHLFRLACKRDLEGIVAKRKFDPYPLDNAKWYKIRNRNHSQWWEERNERSTDPNWHYWNVCAAASDQLVEAPPQ